MGLLFAKLLRLFSSQEHKVIIVGLDNAGKTTILYQLFNIRLYEIAATAADNLLANLGSCSSLMNEAVHTSPTIGSNVEEIVCRSTHFVMWDIGGQESLRASWNSYFSSTDFVILVIDSTDRERLSVAKQELYQMLAHQDLKKAAVLVFANKQDVHGAMSSAQIMQHLNLTSLKDHRWHIQNCCALTREGLNQGLQWMCNQLQR